MADEIQAIEVPTDGHSESRDIAKESSENSSIVEEASDQAQIKVEKGIVEPDSNHNNNNDEERTDPRNASSLEVPERVTTEGDSESHNTPDFSVPGFNTFGEINDNSKRYNSRKRKTRCYNCGRRGHEGHHCKKVTNCFICSKRGHLVMNCPNRNAGEDLTSRLCLKCGNTGHDMFLCANAYGPEDLEEIECYICGKVGHLCCVEDSTKGETEDSCYNCGKWGHFGSECMEVRGPFCHKCKTKGHYPKHCPEKECTEVRGSFCHKCKIKGHYTRHCPQKSRAAMKRSQKALRKLNTNISATRRKIDLAHQNQPSGGPQPPPVNTLNGDSEIRQPTTVQLPALGVSHERDSHVPLNHTVQNNLQQPLSHQAISVDPPKGICDPQQYAQNKPQNPAPNVNHQMGSHVPINHTRCAWNRPQQYMGSETRRPPMVQLLAPNVNHRMDSRVPLDYTALPPLPRSEIRRVQHPTPYVNHRMDSRVPYYEALPTQFSHAVQNSPRNRPHMPFNQELRTPLTRSEIRRIPMVQRPAPIVNHQIDSRVPLNYTAFSHAVQSNPRLHLSRQIVNPRPPIGTFNPGQYRNPEIRVPRPHFGWTFGSSY